MNMRLLRGCGIYPSLFLDLVTKCSERQRGKDCKKDSFMPATSPGRALPSEPLSFFLPINFLKAMAARLLRLELERAVMLLTLMLL